MSEFDDYAESIRASLQEAVTKELEKKWRLGHYAVVHHDGRVMHMVPDKSAFGKWTYEEPSMSSDRTE